MRLGALMIGQVGFDYKHALLPAKLSESRMRLIWSSSQSKYIVLALLVAFFRAAAFWFCKKASSGGRAKPPL